jgi:hypothetical protein
MLNQCHLGQFQHGEANWEIWKQYVEIGLNGIDSTFWPIFVGDNKRNILFPYLPVCFTFEGRNEVRELGGRRQGCDWSLHRATFPSLLRELILLRHDGDSNHNLVVDHQVL